MGTKRKDRRVVGGMWEDDEHKQEQRIPLRKLGIIHWEKKGRQHGEVEKKMYGHIQQTF